MVRKFTLFFTMLLTTSFAFAENCPTVGMIKHNMLNKWQAYDSDNNKPLSAKRLAIFKRNIEQFTLAEWQSKDAVRSTMHCYYRDKNGSQLEAYLTKDDLMPIDNKQLWYQVSGSMHCAAGMDKCMFQRNISQQPQLAKKQDAYDAIQHAILNQ